MSQANFTYHLLQLLLDRLETEGHTYGVDTHLRLHELLKQLPGDYPPERLKTLLAPILTNSRESQQGFYDLFREVYKEVNDLQAWQPPTEPIQSTAKKEEKRWRWLVILLGTAFLLGLLALWKVSRQVEKENRQQFQQTVALYDSTSVFVRGDTLLEQANQVVFQANGRWDNFATALANYRIESGQRQVLNPIDTRNGRQIRMPIDSIKLVITPLDTVGVDSVHIIISNAAGDTLHWTVKSILGSRQNVKVTPDIATQQALFPPIDSLPYFHDIFSLAAEQPTPTEVLLKQYLPWIKTGLLLLATALLLTLLVWRERRRRKLVAEIEQGNQPPYIWDIKFAEPAVIDFGDDLGLLLHQLRQRTDAESSDLDVPATIDATVKGGGMIEFRYRQRTRPPEYLLLIDEQSHRNHRARLFDALYERFKAEEILISRYFYHGDLRLCFNEEHPYGISLPELSGKHPDTRLLIVGSGQGLLSPLNGRLAKWSELLTRWSERVLLSPVSSSEWGRREEQLHQLLPVLPANLVSLGFLIDQMDAGEEGEIDKWQQATRHRALPPLRLNEDGLLSSLKAHFSPDLLHWLAACAVYPRLQFELTCQLGKLISPPDNNLLTVENINRLNQLPWLVEGKMPPAVRMVLLDYLEKEQPALLLRVRTFLHTSLQASAPPAESAAANEHHLQLALNEWLFTQDKKRKAELEKEIAQQLRAGTEADFTVIKFLDRERSPLDFIVPDRWKRYFSYSDYPALDWRELKQDLRWALPLWGVLLAGIFWYSPALPDTCEEEPVLYQEQPLCISTCADQLLYLEQLAIDTIAAGDLAAFDQLLADLEQAPKCLPQEIDSSFSAQVVLNLGTALYNQGAALYRENGDSACLYFAIIARLLPEDLYTLDFVRAMDWCGALDEQPIAHISTKNGSQMCCAPCTIQLANLSINYDSILWVFEDGSTSSSEVEPTRIYSRAGVYANKLIIKNGQKTSTSQLYITVSDCSTDKTLTISGTVRSANGNALIPDAELSSDYGPARTDTRGRYTLRFVPDEGYRGKLLLKINAAGYTPYEQYVLTPIADNRANFTLEKAAQSTPTAGNTGTQPDSQAPTTTSDVPPTPAETLPAATTPADIATNMIRVPGGTFTMGCQDGRDTDCESDEKPAHEVTLSSFSISKYEVTQAQWRAVMGSGSDPSYNSGCDACPVEQVSWNDIQEFLQKLNAQTGQNYRLPTEAEWEYAARGGTKSRGYLYSGSNTIGEVAWYRDNYEEGNTHGTEKTTRPVGGKKPNELGLYDMSGNVYEWCSDWYGAYENSAQQNPRGPESGSSRVYRGGSWSNYPGNCRSANRNYWGPPNRYAYVGFRLARS